MTRTITLLLSFLSWCTCTAIAQPRPQVAVLTSGTKTSVRGLSVVNDSVVWVSGSGGKVGRSINSGKDWQWITVAGFEKTDFRDIEAFSSKEAVIMGIAEPAYILKTTDGGTTWKPVFTDSAKGMFLDAMDFRNNKEGVVVGDPVGGRFFMATTKDGGDSWQPLPYHRRPLADSGEACFASSGTNIRLLPKGDVLVSGGLSSHLISSGKKSLLPLLQGKETTGANSVAFYKKSRLIVGGDFNAPAAGEKACYYSTDNGNTWKAPQTVPNGYRSCVEYLTSTSAVTCGLTGVDITSDGGRNWQQVSAESFHVCRKAKRGTAVYLAGGNGKIGKLVW